MLLVARSIYQAEPPGHVLDSATCGLYELLELCLRFAGLRSLMIVRIRLEG
jgi:hypothetical protein